ncbi:MAG: lysoplasmalogenase family protein [Angelakisella sp.]
MTLILLLYPLLFAMLMVTCYCKGWKRWHTVTKTATSAVFVAAAVAAGNSTDSYFQFMLAGLLLCLLGDFFLAKAKSNTKTPWFFLGGGAFFFAHVVFIAGLSRLDPLSAISFLLPVSMVALVLLLSWMGILRAGKLLPLVGIYIFFVSMLSSKSIGLFLLNPASTRGILAMVGAILFCISDLIILFILFREKPHPALTFVNLLTYYLATMLLALSVG